MAEKRDDGGPAFPLQAIVEPLGGCLIREGNEGYLGMTLRDWLAGQALAGLVSRIYTPQEAARLALEYADAMLAQRAKFKEQDDG